MNFYSNIDNAKPTVESLETQSKDLSQRGGVQKGTLLYFLVL